MKLSQWLALTLVLSCGDGPRQLPQSAPRDQIAERTLDSQSRIAEHPESADPEHLIGSIHHSLHPIDDVVQIGGWMILNPDLTNYAVADVIYRNERYFLLDSLVGRDGQHPIWKVLDVLKVPPNADTLYVALQGCQVGDGPRDGTLFAAVRPDEVEVWYDVHRAWRVDLQTRAFREVSIDGVSCVNDSWGV